MSMKLRPGGWGEAVSDGTHLEVNAEAAAVNHTRFEVGGTGPTSKRPTEFSGCTYDGSRRLSSSASFVTAPCDARWVANTCRTRAGTGPLHLSQHRRVLSGPTNEVSSSELAPAAGCYPVTAPMGKHLCKSMLIKNTIQ